MIWDVDEAGMGKIYNEFLPTCEVPQMDFLLENEPFNKKCLSMKFLSDLDNTDKETKLIKLLLLSNRTLYGFRSLRIRPRDWSRNFRKQPDEIFPNVKKL